jgi:type I restriction-modification system DNA methylase subunit
VETSLDDYCFFAFISCSLYARLGLFFPRGQLKNESGYGNLNKLAWEKNVIKIIFVLPSIIPGNLTTMFMTIMGEN